MSNGKTELERFIADIGQRGRKTLYLVNCSTGAIREVTVEEYVGLTLDELANLVVRWSMQSAKRAAEKALGDA